MPVIISKPQSIRPRRVLLQCPSAQAHSSEGSGLIFQVPRGDRRGTSIAQRRNYSSQRGPRCGAGAEMAPSDCCPTAVRGAAGVSPHALGHHQHRFCWQPRGQEPGAPGWDRPRRTQGQPCHASPQPSAAGGWESREQPPGAAEPVTAITVRDSRFPTTGEFNVHRDTTESVGSAATASCSSEPLARDHMFITGRRAPCHGVMHYLYEGSSSQNNTQA